MNLKTILIKKNYWKFVNDRVKKPIFSILSITTNTSSLTFDVNKTIVAKKQKKYNKQLKKYNIKNKKFEKKYKNAIKVI